jgi:2-haloacid dehalogenase
VDVKAIVFDSYGTLFDPKKLEERLAGHVPDPATFLDLWREKQRDYFLLADATAHDATFTRVTRDALEYACDRCRCNMTLEDEHELVSAWKNLPPYPDVRSGLEAIGRRMPLGLLSNGTEPSLLTMLDVTDLEVFFKWVRTADEVHRFKPSPAVYELACHATGANPEDILYVSAHPWDVAGAGIFGFVTCRILRTNEPHERFGPKPDFVVKTLDDLPAAFGAPGQRAAA